MLKIYDLILNLAPPRKILGSATDPNKKWAFDHGYGLETKTKKKKKYIYI